MRDLADERCDVPAAGAGRPPRARGRRGPRAGARGGTIRRVLVNLMKMLT